MSPVETGHVATLQIDGQDVSARENETVLEAARQAGIEIPTLCHVEGLSIAGACRLCLVEVEGVNRPLPACWTKVSEGMQVRTQSPRLQRYRQLILQMLLAERNHVCSVCVSNGNCELQSLAQQHGVDHVELAYRWPALGVDSSHDRFRLDHNRCVLCGRCVRVCGEIEGAHTKDFAGRGIEAEIINDLKELWGDSETCTACGKCVHVCPTGALSEKGLSVAEMVKQRRFLPYLTFMRETHNGS